MQLCGIVQNQFNLLVLVSSCYYLTDLFKEGFKNENSVHDFPSQLYFKYILGDYADITVINIF